MLIERLRELMKSSTLGLAAILVLLIGCQPAADAEPRHQAAPQAASDMASVMIDSVSYRLDRTIQYALYDLSKPLTKNSAIGGAIVSRLATGGEKGCCLSLPRKWHPGMKLRVVWKEADQERILPEEYTRDLEIPAYDQAADLYVVFYPEHDVEIVVSFGEPGNDLWRGRIKQTPWEQCVETTGRKPCKAALPKFFDIKSTGLCTYMQDQKTENAADLCLSATLDCMRDYEDETFCKSILWGMYKK